MRLFQYDQASNWLQQGNGQLMIVDSKPRKAVVAACFALLCAVFAGMFLGNGCRIDAQGAPSSVVAKGPTAQSGAVQSTFGGMGSGVINGDSGQTWVEGSGLLTNAANAVCNDWAKAWSDTKYVGIIQNAEGKWRLKEASAEVKLLPTAIYVTSNPAYLENYRVECHAVLEIRGDFWSVVANKQTIDNYTAPGTGYYDAIGGGTPPATYSSIGVESIVTGPGPWSGVVMNNGTCVQSYSGEYIGNSVVFYLYAAGTQYIHNDEEEDVSLYTGLDHPADDEGNVVKGWHGNLESWVFQGGKWVLLASYEL